VPGAELAGSGRRSGIGRFSRRWDIAALAVVFTFGSLLNAFGMVAPIHGIETWMAGAMGVASEAPVLLVLFVAALVVLPVLLLGLAAIVTKRLAGDRQRSVPQIAVNFAYGLVPFGFGMWLAHYGFHLLTGAFAVVPVTQRAAADVFGWPALGEPLWRLTGMRPGSVLPIQIGFILLGAMGSFAASFRVADRDYPARTGPSFAPWALVVVALLAGALWLVAQPMDMRGLGFAG
jgi:hypothetical protein